MNTAAPPRRTPLYEAHVESGGKLVPFAGWELPLSYTSQIEEHHWTRQALSLFDVSHMGQIRITGPDAEAMVQAFFTRDAQRIAAGRQLYGVLCTEQGGLVDDLIVARMADGDWLAVVNAATRETDLAALLEIQRRSGLARVDIVDESDQWAMISVQGPLWIEACRAALGGGDWMEMRPFGIVTLEYRGTPLILSTTGYTGEAGCELLCAPERALELWRALLAAGARPAGLAARDSLRLEMGYCLSGQDFTVDHNPLEAGLSWAVDLDKGEFHGSSALRRIKAQGVRRRLVGLLPEGRRIPRHGAAILAGDVPVGEVTSGGFSPTLGRPIAMGYVAIEQAQPGLMLDVDLGRGATARAGLIMSPFLQR